MSFPTVSRNATLEQIATVVDRINRGKVNVTLDVTLTANAASTTIADARIAGTSALVFDPLTANAAAESAAGTMYVTAANRSNGSATITHANNSQTDRTFRLVVLG